MKDSLPVYFIADLHLNDQQPEIYQRFKEFIDSKARTSRALYILGDLFEYYLGDDALTPVAQRVANELNSLATDWGVKIYFMHGNRDFLLAEEFAKLANITLLTDPYVLDLDSKKILLTHADQLCTDDVEYQKVRLQLRDPQWQQWFLSLTVSQRIEFAEKAREKSKQHTSNADSDIMDVNAQAVQELFANHQLQDMLHGHTHRPAIHSYKHKGQEYRRMVLGDWHYQSSFIEYKNGQFQLLSC